MKTLSRHNVVKRAFAGLFCTLIDTGSAWIGQIVDLIGDGSLVGGAQAFQTDNLFFICQTQLVTHSLRATDQFAYKEQATWALATLAQLIAKAGEFTQCALLHARLTDKRAATMLAIEQTFVHQFGESLTHGGAAHVILSNQFWLRRNSGVWCQVPCMNLLLKHLF